MSILDRQIELLTKHIQELENKAKLADELAERLETSHDSIVLMLGDLPDLVPHDYETCPTCALLARYAETAKL